MSRLVYLATPYFHESPEVRQDRFEAVCDITGKLMLKGIVVYSPIVHNHPIADRMDLPKDWGFWQKYDGVMLSRCDELWVIQMDGWLTSRGIAAEVSIAKQLGKPIRYWRVASDFPLVEIELNNSLNEEES